MPVSRAFALFALLATLSPASAQEAAWEPTSGPRSGYTNSLTAADDGRLFVVAAGDLYRSDDERKPLGTRAHAPRRSRRLRPRAPTAPSSSGPSISCTETCHQEGAYASIDDGGTWTRIEVFGELPLVYGVAAAADGRVFASTGLGLFYSDDGGASWTPTPLGVSNAYGLAAHRAGYVGALGYGVGPAALSYSSDNGETWTTTPLPPELPPAQGPPARRAGQRRRNANPHQQAEALYCSTDGGVRWKPFPFPALCSTAHPVGWTRSTSWTSTATATAGSSLASRARAPRAPSASSAPATTCPGWRRGWRGPLPAASPLPATPCWPRRAAPSSAMLEAVPRTGGPPPARGSRVRGRRCSPRGRTAPSTPARSRATSPATTSPPMRGRRSPTSASPPRSCPPPTAASSRAPRANRARGCSMRRKRCGRRSGCGTCGACTGRRPGRSWPGRGTSAPPSRWPARPTTARTGAPPPRSTR